jgi:hypothetical protein
LICSAAILDNHVTALHALNVHDFLTKPYHPLDLLNRITCEISRPRPLEDDPKAPAFAPAGSTPEAPYRSSALGQTLVKRRRLD